MGFVNDHRPLTDTKQISKHKRHLDATAALEFWNTLDDFITKKKPYIAS